MEEKLDKIIELLEDVNIKLDLLEIEIEEIKNGVTESSTKTKEILLEYSLKVSQLRLKKSDLQGGQS